MVVVVVVADVVQEMYLYGAVGVYCSFWVKRFVCHSDWLSFSSEGLPEIMILLLLVQQHFRCY